MYQNLQRLTKLSKKNSFFLFGPRGSGKSSLLRAFFQSKGVWWFDLLEVDVELSLRTHPELLKNRYLAAEQKPQWIIIDEVQKAPALLDVVHWLIEKHGVKFALTGSSARKLKRGGANMLAGRAHEFHLHPLTHIELGEDFDLLKALSFGTLPKLLHPDYSDDVEKTRYLKTYVNTYLKEEILAEQVIRKIEPFHRFLEVAAQMNGEILNYSGIGRQAKVDDKSVERYYEILIDTLLGFSLPGYHKSVRKQLMQSPRFYFFDPGVVRALRGSLTQPLTPSTYEFGKLFEQFVVLEIHRLNQYYEKDFKLYYLRTKEGKEIDLIIETPAGKTFLIEIKSGKLNTQDNLKGLTHLLPDFKNAIPLVLCANTEPVMIGDKINAIHWQHGIRKIFHG